jgi:hypothetical protein
MLHIQVPIVAEETVENNLWSQSLESGSSHYNPKQHKESRAIVLKNGKSRQSQEIVIKNL